MKKWCITVALLSVVVGLSQVAVFGQPPIANTTITQFGELESQLSPDALGIFQKAEVLYVDLFSNASEFRTTEGFIYKFYAAQSTYIGIRDDTVYLLGGPFGSAITNYGTVADTFAYLVNVENIALSALLDPVFANGWQTQTSNLQVQGTGLVWRLLADDLNGDAHQRFIVRLRSGQTLLVAHNIDLAPRIAAIRVGDEVAFYGEYEWSAEGGGNALDAS
jgi:hypothetical protein